MAEANDTIRLPGLIDAHVHLRDPDQTEKEDFRSGSEAALAGGFTHVLDMPNNAEPITTPEKLHDKIGLAREKAIANIGFHYGSLGDNLSTFEEAARYAKGLKLYLNQTTGNYLLDVEHLKKIYAAWPQDKPVLLHAEEDVIDTAIESIHGLDRPVHVCHVPSRAVLQEIIKAKSDGAPITCGVCPHHLFLTEADAEQLEVYGQMRPPLQTEADQTYLWEHMDDIDIIESDHAPHTREQKEAGAFGVPGLETTLPLLLRAERDGWITRQQIIDKCHTTPARIFDIPVTDDTYVDVDMHEYELSENQLHTKCGWSPFIGYTVYGKVFQVVIDGETVFHNGRVLAKPGTGAVMEGA